MIAVILAGGSGTRFWPLSRAHRPKQLVRLMGDRVMIAQTFDRLASVVSPERVYVVCGESLAAPILEAIPELPADNLILEPMARNTAPAIVLASEVLAARHGDEVIGFFPSDHFIGQPDAFARTLQAASAAAETPGTIVTLGIAPTRPETGYGYIARGEQQDAHGAYAVDAFKEKPDLETALEYLQHGGYLWNAGIFFFRPSTLAAELTSQRSSLQTLRDELATAMGQPQYEEVLQRSFAEAEKISIDYAVMENASKIKVLPAMFPWSDVGHWASLDEVAGRDAQGNVCEARVALHEVTDSIFYSADPNKRIAAIGLSGVVVVDTPNAILVMPKDRAQDVRAIVAMLEDEER